MEFKYTEQDRKMLKQANADFDVYSLSQAFDLDDLLVAYKPKVKHIKSQLISADAQRMDIDNFMDETLDFNGVFVVASYPTDIRAKLVAAQMLLACYRDYLNTDIRKRKGDAPIWHRLTNRYDCPVANGKVRPSALVISNVTQESTPQRFERLRDILETHQGIPRIIVTSTKENPVSFVADKLHYAVQAAALIGAPEMVVKSLMDI